MKRTLAVTCLLWMFVWASLGVWGACPANNPNNPFAITMQGGDPTGNLGYPIAVVGATGCPLDVNVVGGGGNCVTQCTSPWVVSGTVTANQGAPNAAGATSWPIQGAVPDLAFPPFGNGVPIGGMNVNSGRMETLSYFDRTSSGHSSSPTITVPCGIMAYLIENGQQQVLDATITGLDAVQNNNRRLMVESFPLVYNGSKFDTQRTPLVFKTVTAAAAGNTPAWTPTAGFKFRLMRYQVIVTDNATQAAPGTLTISLNDAGAALNQVHPVFVPAIGLVNSGSLYTSGWIDLGNGELSAAANNVLNVNLSAALTAGQVQVNLCGTEE